jgi:hypothetical protein
MVIARRNDEAIASLRSQRLCLQEHQRDIVRLLRFARNDFRSGRGSALGIEVKSPQRSEDLQRKARPVGKRPKIFRKPYHFQIIFCRIFAGSIVNYPLLIVN